MSCKHHRERLGPLARGELSPRQAAEVNEHLAGCAACGRALDETRATLSLLRRLGAAEEALPFQFQAGLHRALVQAGPPEPASLWARLGERLAGWPARAVAAGAAASLLLAGGAALHRGAVGAGALATTVTASGPVDPVFRVPHHKVAMVRIDFVSEADVDDVEFAVVLPRGLHFVSQGQVLPDREFRWRGRLEQGSNPIPVAVRGERAGRYVVAARATAAVVDVQHQVVLEVTPG